MPPGIVHKPPEHAIPFRLSFRQAAISVPVGKLAAKAHGVFHGNC
jgi:hypothetical protein